MLQVVLVETPRYSQESIRPSCQGYLNNLATITHDTNEGRVGLRDIARDT